MNYSLKKILAVYITLAIFIVLSLKNDFIKNHLLIPWFALIISASFLILFSHIKKKWLLDLSVAVGMLSVLVIGAITLNIKGLVSSDFKAKTKSTIKQLQASCEIYKMDWLVYPDVINSPVPIVIPGKPTIKYQGDNFGKITAKNFKQIEVAKAANKRLMFLLSNPYWIGGVLQQPIIPGFPVNDQGTKSEHDDLVVDSWGNFVRILPGRDHRKDNPAGPNYFHKNRNKTPLDIYSVGKDGVDETGNSFTQTSLDRNKADDIVNWYGR